MSPPVRVCLLASELVPFAKTGGLGDVCGALAAALHRAGHDVRPFVPFYSQIDTRGASFHPVSFARDVPLDMVPGIRAFTVYTTELPGTNLPVYLIDCPELFHRRSIYTSGADEGLRFAFFTRAVLETCQRMGWGPDVFHANDWPTALLPVYLRTLYAWDELFAASKTLLTIHNIGYQGVFGAGVLAALGLEESRALFDQEDLAADRVSFLKTGILYAGALSTVSRTHAREIASEAYGMGLDSLLRARGHQLVGIVNGIDPAVWNPARDPHLPYPYSAEDLSGKAKNKRYLLDGMGLAAEDGVPVLAVVSRLMEQKGLELLGEVLPELLARRDLRVVVLGTGEARYEELFQRLQDGHPGRVVFYRGYNERLAHLVEAGADLFVMPSRYEPCGLNQMYSQIYGTPPVVRRTGGLADTVTAYNPATGEGTGFVFEHFSAGGLRWALDLALDTYGDRKAWLRLMRNGMAQDFSWDTRIEEYIALYRGLIAGKL